MTPATMAAAWDAAPKSDASCERTVRRLDYSADPDGEWVTEFCGETPTVGLEGASRGFRGKRSVRCRAHAISSAGVYRVPREVTA